MNSVLLEEKQPTRKRKLSIPEFLRLLETVVKLEKTEKDLAFIGLRELKMDERYTELEIKESVFYWKMRAQQEAMLKKFHNLPVKTDDLLLIDRMNQTQKAPR